MRVLITLLLVNLLVNHSYSTESIAHRGFTTRSIENTIEAIREAWEFDADIVEVDIHVLKDDQLVLFHDREYQDMPISSLNYNELQSLVKYHIPTLQEALTEVPSDKAMLLDLKSSSRDLYEALQGLMEGKSLEFEIIFQSSNIAFLSHLKANFPDKFTYQYLTKLERKGVFFEKPLASDIAKIAKDAKMTGVSVKGRQFIDQAFVDAFQSENLRFFVWTINDPNRIEFYSNLGVDGIITDNPIAPELVKSKTGAPGDGIND